MKNNVTICYFVILISLCSVYGENPGATIDETGIIVNGVKVSVNGTANAFAITNKQMITALGKPLRVIQTKVDGELNIWNGIWLYSTTSQLLFDLFKSDTWGYGPYRGSILIEGVSITSNTSISEVNASLEKNNFRNKVNPANAAVSIWDLKYDKFTVRLFCNKDTKISSVWIEPNSNSLFQ